MFANGRADVELQYDKEIFTNYAGCIHGLNGYYGQGCVVDRNGFLVFF